MKKKNNENQNKCITTDGCCRNQIARAFSFNSRYIQVDFIIGQSFSLFRFPSLRSLPFNFPLIYCWRIIFFRICSLWLCFGGDCLVYPCLCMLFVIIFFSIANISRRRLMARSRVNANTYTMQVSKERIWFFFSVMNWIDRLQSRRREGKIYREEFLFNWTSEQCSKRQQ